MTYDMAEEIKPTQEDTPLSPIPVPQQTETSFEDVLYHPILKVDKLHAGLPMFDAVPTYVGKQGETVLVDTDTFNTHTMKVLVIGGGGGAPSNGGGGGAGSYRYFPTQTIEEMDYSITVGAKGSGANNGSDSLFGSLITAYGGGHGGTLDNNGADGGSGGGGGKDNGGGVNSGGVGIGAGGNGGASGNGASAAASGGGGGAGAAGTDGVSGAGGHGGNGGNGIANSITGASVTYAGGGAGAHSTPGTNGTGQGNAGGGADANNGTDAKDGVVIISYVTANFGACTGGTITTDGANTVHTFTSNGTFSVLFLPKYVYSYINGTWRGSQLS